MMMMFLQEEEEEVAEVEEAVMPTPEEEELEDKTQSNPSRKPRLISQHYERCDVLPDPKESRELADLSATFRSIECL